MITPTCREDTYDILVCSLDTLMYEARNQFMGELPGKPTEHSGEDLKRSIYTMMEKAIEAASDRFNQIVDNAIDRIQQQRPVFSEGDRVFVITSNGDLYGVEGTVTSVMGDITMPNSVMYNVTCDDDTDRGSIPHGRMRSAKNRIPEYV